VHAAESLDVEHAVPSTAAVQGVVQTVFAILFALLGASFDDARPMWGAPFWISLGALAVALVGLGVAVDWRRRRAPLPLVAPVLVRRILAGVAIALPVLLSLKDAPQFFVCALIGALSIWSPYLFVTLDRILGPAWVLGPAATRAWARRRWARCTVIELDGVRAVVEDDRSHRFLARTELALEPGVAYLALSPISAPAEPYRDAEVRAIVLGHETVAARTERSRAILTAALALLSGLAWVALPFALALGPALVR
jgi:hypothetical protein